jgi:hypothetical protein
MRHPGARRFAPGVGLQSEPVPPSSGTLDPLKEELGNAPVKEIGQAGERLPRLSGGKD